MVIPQCGISLRVHPFLVRLYFDIGCKNPADPIGPLVSPQVSGGIHYHGPTTGSGPNPPSGTLRSRADFRNYGDGMMGHWHLASGGSDYSPYFHWWKSFVHLLPCSAASAQPVTSGMIVMYSGSSAPEGWYVCDGNNGTPNLSERFIGYNNAESGTNVVVGRSNVGTEDTSVPGTPGWPTTAGPTYNAPTVSVNWYVDSGTDPWPHTHIAGSYRSSTFYITGHPNAMPGTAHSHAFYTPAESPSPTTGTTTSVSSEYVPKHITVLFIQRHNMKPTIVTFSSAPEKLFLAHNGKSGIINWPAVVARIPNIFL